MFHRYGIASVLCLALSSYAMQELNLEHFKQAIEDNNQIKVSQFCGLFPEDPQNDYGYFIQHQLPGLIHQKRSFLTAKKKQVACYGVGGCALTLATIFGTASMCIYEDVHTQPTDARDTACAGIMATEGAFGALCSIAACGYQYLKLQKTPEYEIYHKLVALQKKHAEKSLKV